MENRANLLLKKDYREVMPIDLNRLIELLNVDYLYQFHTQIIGGFDEPFYQAASDGKLAEIQFSHDYIRSALHELSHWCVAGLERRNFDDFGYWYAEDGRNQQQQDEFFKLEIKPQAIEWAFSLVCGIEFEISVDNLNSSVVGIDAFEINVLKQLNIYLKNGFIKRASEILLLMAEFNSIDSYDEFIYQSITPQHR